MNTSSQVGALDEGNLDDPTPDEVPATYSPTNKTLGPSSDLPPLDITHLCEETNKALGDWLAVKSSIDANHQKLVSKFSMTLHQNESKTEESIKEAKALCGCSISKAETDCAHSIKEAKAHCSTAIKEGEVLGASQASCIQQSHVKAIQHLEEEAVKEDNKGQLNFLSGLLSCPGDQASFLSSITGTHIDIASFQHPPRSIPLPTRAHPGASSSSTAGALTQTQVMASLTRFDGNPTSQLGYIQGKPRFKVVGE